MHLGLSALSPKINWKWEEEKFSRLGNGKQRLETEQKCSTIKLFSPISVYAAKMSSSTHKEENKHTWENN